jgi:hypothetical protein
MLTSTGQPRQQPTRNVRQVEATTLPRFDSFLVDPDNTIAAPWQRFFQFVWQKLGGPHSTVQNATFSAQVPAGSNNVVVMNSLTGQAVSSVLSPGDAAATFVNKSGDTMTGLLILSGSPGSPLGAATKNYVDTGIASSVAGLVPEAPTDGRVYARSGSTRAWNALPLAHNRFFAGLTDPPATTSTTSLMCGLNCAITPILGNAIFLCISGRFVNTTAGNSSSIQLRTGSGIPPGAGAAATGIMVGNGMTVTANDPTPFTLQGILSGQPLGSQAWFDLAQASPAGGSTQLSNLNGTAFEI